MPQPSVHFLDEATYDWSKPEAVELHEILVCAYPAEVSATFIIAKSGIDRYRIHLRQPARNLWMEALEAAASEGLLRTLVQNAKDDRGIAAYRPRLERLLGSNPTTPEAKASPKKDAVWRGKELITGNQPTFLEMSFFHEGLRIAASVVRLLVFDHDYQGAFGTGFLIAKDVILTNHHVLYDKDGRPRKQVNIWFNYERDASGNQRVVDFYEGDTSTIQGDEGHDWAIIRPRKPFKDIYPALNLRPSKPVAKDDFVYIIQHPAGQTKKIGLVHNQVVDVTPDHIQYLTDTLGGSSGSPVCNDLWEVVALHSDGIEDPAEHINKKNEGTHIDRVVEALAARGILGS